VSTFIGDLIEGAEEWAFVLGECPHAKEAVKNALECNARTRPNQPAGEAARGYEWRPEA